ncbi:MAG: hypothetical protein WC451_06470 [Patescibacteria group bacterium]|jgi:uncharacterized protein YdaT
MKKSKKTGQNWWKNLSPEEKDKYLQKKFEQKKHERYEKQLADKTIYGNCEDCFHHKSKSCTEIFENGCKYWLE